MPGPLPKSADQRRRRNKPAIPTSKLPAAGLPGPVPEPPEWIPLGPAGLAWWDWAWKLPEAAGWSAGTDVAAARRAALEDDRTALHTGPNLNLAHLLELEPDDQTRAVEEIIRTLARLAAGKLAIDAKATDLDRELGLTPKALAALRWTIAPPDAETAGKKPVRTTTAQRKRMKVLDGGKATA